MPSTSTNQGTSLAGESDKTKHIAVIDNFNYNNADNDATTDSNLYSSYKPGVNFNRREYNNYGNTDNSQNNYAISGNPSKYEKFKDEPSYKQFQSEKRAFRAKTIGIITLIYR
jgi:hypothetical protein